MPGETSRVECGEGHLEWRSTPWDGRVLGAQTAEIMTLVHEGEANALGLVGVALEGWRAAGVAFVVSRIPTADVVTRGALAAHGFWCVEQSLRLRHPRLRDGLPAMRRLGMIVDEPSSEDDFLRVAEIARRDFHFGRIHEDPRVPAALAGERNFQWVGDLRRQGREFRVLRVRGRVEGFHVQAVREGCADLILTGTSAAAAMLSLPFWCTVLSELGERGVVEARTMVSAANVGVMTLYARLGFSFEKSLAGYHWMDAHLQTRLKGAPR